MDFDDLPHLNPTLVLYLTIVRYSAPLVPCFRCLVCIIHVPCNAYSITFVTTRLCILDEILYLHTLIVSPSRLGRGGVKQYVASRQESGPRLLPQRNYLAMFM